MPAPLAFFNSLTRAVEPFRPIDPALVRLYSCGPTVYNHAHLGNLRAYVFTDTLRRTLNWKGYATNHVINITDVGHLTSDADAGDDKLEAAARGSGRDIWEIARFYTDAFKADLESLNIVPPTLWSVATEHIAEMIDFARTIEAHGAAYRLDGGLYFDVSKVPDYGQLAGAHGGAAVARIADVAGKRHPADFALWRTSAPGERRQMEWDSPWGRGAPGWHLECSVMSMKYLGAQFDIHTGGIDHREIHHPNEIAQNQAYTCTSATGANLWMHNNFLVDRTGKMSKSSGEFLTLGSIVARGVHPLAYRLMCLQAHYRSELEFTWEALASALTRLKRIALVAETLREQVQSALRLADAQGLDVETKLTVILPLAEEVIDPTLRRWSEDFYAAVADDLNTPKALVALEQALALKRIDAMQQWTVIEDMLNLLGLDTPDQRLSRSLLRQRPSAATINEAEVASRLERRKAARAIKDFTTGDRLRDELTAAGVEVMDGDPLGWDWKLDFDD